LRASRPALERSELDIGSFAPDAACAPD